MPDLIVDDLVITDPKVVVAFNDSHTAQMIGYRTQRDALSDQVYGDGIAACRRVLFDPRVAVLWCHHFIREKMAMTWNAAGPRMTMKMAGKMHSNVGNRILTAAF